MQNEILLNITATIIDREHRDYSDAHFPNHMPYAKFAQLDTYYPQELDAEDAAEVERVASEMKQASRALGEWARTVLTRGETPNHDAVREAGQHLLSTTDGPWFAPSLPILHAAFRLIEIAMGDEPEYAESVGALVLTAQGAQEVRANLLASWDGVDYTLEDATT